MPNFDFRCTVCGSNQTDWLPFKAIDNKELYPQCCNQPTIKLMSAPPFKFTIPPSGHYFATIGKTCHTEAEFIREAEKTKKGMREEAKKKGNWNE